MTDPRVHRLSALLAYVPPRERARFVASIPAPMLGGAADHELAPLLGLDAATLTAARDRVRRAPHRTAPARQDDVLNAMGAIAADAASRDRLAALRAPAAATPDEPVRVTVRIGDMPLRIVFPHNWMSYSVLHEVLFERAYAPPGAVRRVFDVGANIGIAALFFHARMPSAEIVCVEPSSYCLRFLEENLAENGVRGQIVRAAADRHSGHAQLFVPPAAAHACSSQYIAAGRPETVPAIAWRDLIAGDGYGLKVDAEGAEHALADEPQILTRAAWVTGEIHYGAWLRGGSPLRLDETLRAHTRVKFRRAALGFAGTVVRRFRARPRHSSTRDGLITQRSAQADGTGQQEFEAVRC